MKFRKTLPIILSFIMGLGAKDGIDHFKEKKPVAEVQTNRPYGWHKVGKDMKFLVEPSAMPLLRREAQRRGYEIDQLDDDCQHAYNISLHHMDQPIPRIFLKHKYLY